MNVLLLGIKPSPLVPIVKASRCKVFEADMPISTEYLHNNSVDFVVSYRYRHIIKKNVVEYLKNKIINLHISLLPWNRGADPNLWSFLEDTPKGVTIHHIDEGIDTGDIIAQRSVVFELEHETLATSYFKLNHDIIHLFSEKWPLIKKGKMNSKRQAAGGTFHRSFDKNRFQYLLEEKGWNTPVKELIGQAFNSQN
jgi:methionyl-tRNA formyltransferase